MKRDVITVRITVWASGLPLMYFFFKRSGYAIAEDVKSRHFQDKIYWLHKGSNFLPLPADEPVLLPLPVGSPVAASNGKC